MIALFSDIHANIEAFRAVLGDATDLGVMQWYCLGDIVGYGADPRECVGIVQEKFLGCVLGNHESMLNSAKSNRDCDEYGAAIGRPLKIARNQLGRSKAMALLRDLPLVIEKEEILLVHASPDRPEAFAYIDNDEDAGASFACQDAFVAFYGHTHVPAIWETDGRSIRRTTPGKDPINLYRGSRYLVNVGSVGQPRDDDPRACYAIYDPSRRVLWYRRVAYDIEAAQRRYQEAGLISRNADRLVRGE